MLALLPGLVRRPPPVVVRRDHPREDSVHRLEVGASPSVNVHGTCQGARVTQDKTEFLAHALVSYAPRGDGIARTVLRAGEAS